MCLCVISVIWTQLCILVCIWSFFSSFQNKIGVEVSMRFRFNNSFALHEGAFVFVILIVMEVIWFSYATYPEETAIFTLTFCHWTEKGESRGSGLYTILLVAWYLLLWAQLYSSLESKGGWIIFQILVAF